jgi:hypothetical protein
MKSIKDSERIGYMSSYAVPELEWQRQFPSADIFLPRKLADVEKDIWFHASLIPRTDYFEVSRLDQESGWRSIVPWKMLKIFGPVRLDGVHHSKTEDTTFRNILMI